MVPKSVKLRKGLRFVYIAYLARNILYLGLNDFRSTTLTESGIDPAAL